MNERYKQRLETARGEVIIQDHVQPADLDPWEMDQGLGDFSSYRSILTTKDSLYGQANDHRVNLCLAIYQNKNIVGFSVKRPAPEDERWSELDPPIMYEVFGEVGRGWRNQGLIRPMLTRVCLEAANEDLILYIVGYSWHWDLDHTKKTTTQYRDTIIHILSPLGFRQLPTNEPNIGLRPENLFMARIGTNVDKPTQKRFKNLLFGIRED